LIQAKRLIDVDSLKAFRLLSCFVDIFIDGSQDWPRRCDAREYLENWLAQAQRRTFAVWLLAERPRTTL
jgi:hypothetical protein